MTAENRFESSNVQDLTDDRLRNDLLPGQKPLPLPPLQFVVEDTGGGVRVTVVNDGPLGGRLNGAIRYDVYFATDVDTTTAAGKAAGIARAVCLAPSLPATGVDHTQSSAIYNDPKYAAGYFCCCGVDPDGRRSEFTEFAKVTTGAVDLSVPGDVTHLEVSESGRVANGTVLSELSVTASPPSDVTNFGGLQLYLKDFDGLGSVQEGYFHHWLGSGGINFDVLYPIPRRRGPVALTLANGSNAATAASSLLSVAQQGDSLEVAGRLISITIVTDTAITLASNWDLPTLTTSDWSVIALVTVYGVAIGRSGSRRADITGAPSIPVLMDANISTPNAPAQIYLTNSGISVLIEWDQVAGSTIDGYNVYRSDGASLDVGMVTSPPKPAAGTVLLDKVTQNQNLPVGSTYARMQTNDSRFTLYDLEVNAAFIWYVTTTNTRGDESGANYITGNCRQTVTGDIDPNQTGRNPGKNYVYDAPVGGTAGNGVLANDTSQDTFIGTDASNLPGRPYGAASGQANGLGRFRGYTRWEANDAGGGAAGSVKFQNGDEVVILPPGAGKIWYVYQEIGAWDEASGAAFKKVGKGEVYTLSFYIYHQGVTPNGIFSGYIEAYDNNTFKAESLRRFRDSSSNIVASSTPLDVPTANITATPTRWQAAFQLDSSISPTRQIRVNFSWGSGTTGAIVLKRIMLNGGEIAAQWTADMGDPTICLPVPATPVDPLGDQRTERNGDLRFSPP